MCIDFTILNKACPKDEYPLPCIDTLVDAAACSEMLSMLDCFSGYHQIFMNKADKKKTSFTTPFGTYCYVRTPEGLRNARCTFNRMIKTVLGSNWEETSLHMSTTWSSKAGKRKIAFKIFAKPSTTRAETES